MTPDRPQSLRPPEKDTSLSSNLARWSVVTLAAGLLPLMVAASFHFGVTWDEKARHRNGELTWEFLRGSVGQEAFPESGGHLYGGLFDVVCVAAEHLVKADRYVVRHVVNAVFGWMGVVYAGRLAARLFGPWAALLAMVLLTASPRYFAHSMNNPKDLPFAALSVVILYYLSTISPKWPYISKTTALKIAISLGLALNVRAGALIYAGYFAILIAAYVIVEQTTDWRRLADTLLRVAAVFVAMFLLGTIFWPWAQVSPFTRPIEALLGLSKFTYNGLVLFDGREYSAMGLPWSYVPWWLLISTPPVVIAGALFSLATMPWRRAVFTWVLWGVAVLPVVLVVVQHSTLYDGIRHLLFVYPLIAVIAASGWVSWISADRRRWVRIVMSALLAIGLADVLAFNVRAFPNQVVYFNQLVGGPRGAFARYDMDYWGNCVLEAVSWTASIATLAGTPIVVSGNPWHLVELDAARFHQLSFALPALNQHFVNIRLNRGPIAGITELARRPDALHQVKTPDGVVLCVVLPGPAYKVLKPYLVPAPR